MPSAISAKDLRRETDATITERIYAYAYADDGAARDATARNAATLAGAARIRQDVDRPTGWDPLRRPQHQ